MVKKVYKIAALVVGLLSLAVGSSGTVLAEMGAKDIFEEEMKKVQKASALPVAVPPEVKRPKGKLAEQSTPGPSKKTIKRQVTSESNPQGPANKGIMYWIELLTTDELREQVAGDSKRVFRTGERVRFHFRMNTDGYMYILQKGARGNTTMLFPDPRVKGGDNYVQKGADYVIPEEMWFKFDEPPGELELLVMLSRNKVTVAPEATLLEPKVTPPAREAPSEKRREANVIEEGRKKPDVNVAQGEREKPDIEKLLANSIIVAKVEEQTGSKDLRLETVGAGPNPASYVVTISQDPEWMVAFRITLKQQ